VEVTLDGQRADNIVLAGERGRSLLCPPGRHQVTAVTEKWSEFAVRVSSVGLSVGIVAVSWVVLGLVVSLFLWARVCHKSLGLSEQPK